MNQEPVSLAELVEQLAGIDVYREDGACDVIEFAHAGEYVKRSSVLQFLAQHAVAEPQNEKWHGFIGGLNGKPEFCKYCGEPERSYRHAPAHAAEQPKLTEAFLRETLKPILLWYKEHDISIHEALDDCVDTLLTSPVAPPPPREKFHETIGYETDYMRGRREMREEIASGDAPPPVAPGEQPPLKLNRVNKEQMDVLLAEAEKDPLAKCAAQERASDGRNPREEIIFQSGRLFGLTEGMAKCDELLATAAKLAREEATLAEHKSHIEFENELYATLVDPVAEGNIKEAEMRKQLLESARWYRQHVHDLEAQLNAIHASGKDHAG